MNSPSVTIEKSIISKNRIKSLQKRAAGGGIFSPQLIITDSIVSENSVNASSTDLYGAAGGGIDIEILGKGIMTQGSLTLNRTTISRNTVKNNQGGAAGGGLFTYEAPTTTVPFSLTNCTIADNKVEGGSKAGGGGLALHMLKSHNNRINFCTIYGNIAPQGGGIATNWIDTPKIPELSLKNSIVAGNSASIAPDISGAITTNGYNLVQNFTGALITDPANKHKTDISGGPFPTLAINAQLGNNGGPTPTLTLQADSPAIDAIPTTACDVPTDQRGIKRPQHNACDIGSSEYE